MKTIEQIKNWRILTICFLAVAIVSCSDDDDAPPEENEMEVLTDVTLIFTNTADAQDVVRARAQDPDDGGAQQLQVLDTISLKPSTTYRLTFSIQNALDPNDIEDIGEEIKEEDNEHQFFYAFTDDVFTDPTGDGNIDNASDPVNYEDEDSDAQDGSGNPVGLVTTWTTSSTISSGGSFRVMLKHQPDGLKSDSSNSDTGDTDFNLNFVLDIEPASGS